MDRRPLRKKKSTTRNAKPYDRPNQGILGRVASKFKGIISQWMGTPEEEEEDTDPQEEGQPEEDEYDEDQEERQPSSSTRGSKRTRLEMDHPAPSILSEGTQTWMHTPSSGLFNPSPRLTSTATQNADQVIINGDDHSENSEGSASTSGCSSLVSSHKERSNCLPITNRRLVQSPFDSIRNELSRRDVTSRKEGLSADMSASRMSLWSGSGGFSPAAKMQRRSPSVANTNQPGFNVSAFVGSSKSSQQPDRKVASPFYQGKTSFGGASSMRRMPVSVAPYQTDRPTRNQIKVRPKESDDSLEGMSSAAKRILMTLEKMSSPVTDAKKIPNTNRSPVDLSLYMMPPRLRSNVISTPTITRGPPIANISTISKLTTLKSRMNRFPNSSMESFTSPKETRSTPVIETPQDITLQPLSPSKGGGGGKIRCKLAQKHQPSARNEEFEFTPLPSIPLPISTLPIFKQNNPLPSFDTKSSKSTNDSPKSGIEFEFSPPIEVQPILPPAVLQTNVPSTSDRPSSTEKLHFPFSNPTELETPVSVPGLFTSNLASTKWSCSGCWVQNPANETKCLACETPRNNSNRLPTVVNSTSSSQMPSMFNSTTKSASMWKCSECWIQNPTAESKCKACETPRKSPVAPSGVSSTEKPSSWACNECWIQNPADASKCLACDNPRSTTSAALSNSMRSQETAKPSSWSCHECWIQNPAHTTKCLACEAVRKGQSAPTLATSSSGFGGSAPKLASSFGGFGETTPKLAASSSSGFCESAPKVSGFGGNSSKQSMWNCDSCWVQNPSDKAKCLACEAPNPSQAKSSGLKDSESFKFNSPLQNSPITFKFGSFSIPVPPTTTSTSSFGDSSSTGASSFFASAGSLATTTAKNSEEPKLSFSTNTSTSKPVPGFKFGTSTVPTIEITKPNIPVVDLEDNEDTSVQSSNIFGSAMTKTSENSISTAFKVTPASNASDTGVSSFFKPPSSTDKGLGEPKPTLTDLSTSKPSASLFKFGASNQPTTEAKTANIPVVDLVDTDNDNKAKLTNMFAAAISKSSSELSASSNVFNITPSIGNTNFSMPASTENKLLSFGSAKENPTATSQQPTLNSIPIGSQTGQPKESASTGGFNFKTPTALGSSSPFGGFSMPTSNSDNSKSLLSATAEEKPLSKEASSDKRSDSAFFLGVSSSANAVSPFTLTTSNSSVFKMGNQVDAAKNLTSSTNSATAAAPVFSFGVAAASAATTASHQFPSTNAAKDVKPAVSVVAPFSAAPTTTGGFSFGSVAPPATTTQASANPSGGGFSFFASGTTATAAPSLFTFGASTNASQPAKTGGFPATTTTAPSVFGASTPASTSAFVFGAVKTEPVNSTPSFAFGSGTAQSVTPSSFSGFQTNQPAAPASNVFQFGSQPANNTPAAPAFGGAATTGGFAFGAKSEAPTLQTTGFGVPSMQQQQQPMFGGAAAAAPKTAGFNFGAPAAASTPFMFGSMDKNQQAPAQFSFGNTQEPQNAAQFQPQPAFNINTPTTFNFGATTSGAQAGPFQFAAAASTPEQQSAGGQRKIRKAIRRVRN